ncbi:MAG: DUF192 domain-containing protein [Candidatus Aenigmatarchaeota archaeon]
MKIFKGKTLIADKVEIASGFFQRARGLMLRKSLPKGSALVIVFPKAGKHGIWMPLMRFPIDIVFLDSRKMVVGLHENAKPISFRKSTWKIYYPERPAKYAIELREGEVKRKEIQPKERLVFQLA